MKKKKRYKLFGLTVWKPASSEIIEMVYSFIMAGAILWLCVMQKIEIIDKSYWKILIIVGVFIFIFRAIQNGKKIGIHNKKR